MKIYLLSALFSLCFISCNDNMESELETDTIKITLQGTELYKYKLADAIPTEGGYEIRKQAENYQISKMNWGEYQFQAKEGFRGLETVEIVLSTSIGVDNFTEQKKWIFEIEVE
ncbi:hypothetical protein [Marivirga sp.]|uniref:hypothetical protein n=1 Tax=Marivirga sp. TaxID=2018662 RepID=UPI002D7E75FC|nr:hypothetical protein [Marivirga sp.]HET8860342.1 hypothetical protein [Marivirga sp.]